MKAIKSTNWLIRGCKGVYFCWEVGHFSIMDVCLAFGASRGHFWRKFFPVCRLTLGYRRCNFTVGVFRLAAVALTRCNTPHLGVYKVDCNMCAMQIGVISQPLFSQSEFTQRHTSQLTQRFVCIVIFCSVRTQRCLHRHYNMCTKGFQWVHSSALNIHWSRSAWETGTFLKQTTPRLYYDDDDDFTKKISHDIFSLCHGCSLLITPPSKHPRRMRRCSLFLQSVT